MSFEKKEKTTEQWIFEKLEGVYSKEDDYFDDLIGYIGSFNKWSIFKRRPQDGEVGEYIFFNHSEEEAHMGFQFLLTGILSVYYDKTRNYISRPGFTAFPSHALPISHRHRPERGAHEHRLVQRMGSAVVFAERHRIHSAGMLLPTAMTASWDDPRVSNWLLLIAILTVSAVVIAMRFLWISLMCDWRATPPPASDAR